MGGQAPQEQSSFSWGLSDPAWDGINPGDSNPEKARPGEAGKATRNQPCNQSPNVRQAGGGGTPLGHNLRWNLWSAGFFSVKEPRIASSWLPVS